MRSASILFTFIFFFIFFPACKKELSKKISGNYSFVTHASARIGLNSFADTVINYDGYIRQESQHSVEIKYAPHLDEDIIYVDGTIHPGISSDWTFSYPDFVAQDLHYFFSGNVDDDGTVHLNFGFHGLGSAYVNDVTGTRR